LRLSVLLRFNATSNSALLWSIALHFSKVNIDWNSEKVLLHVAGNASNIYSASVRVYWELVPLTG